MKKLQVNLAERSYFITIADRLLLTSEAIAAQVKNKQALIVTNTTVATLYLDAVLAALNTIPQVDILILPDGEQYKNIETLGKIYDALLSKRHHRTSTLFALGGGVIGDMTGFAAATYQRGIDFVQLPTTLLAMVDSSVGGKTGVNHPLGKNMIGAFYQPRAVLIDVSTLKTLPERELCAGIAEIIKYGLINDPDFFAWLEQNVTRLLAREHDALIFAIERSCRNKATIVAADEREVGERALLNLGHTFGHAIEAHQGYGQWLHGEAVAVGMMIAATLSQQIGWMTAEETQRVRRLLVAAKLPIHVPAGMTPAHFFEKMSIDKKNTSSRIRFVLLKGIGQALLSDEPSREQVERAILSCCV